MFKNFKNIIIFCLKIRFRTNVNLFYDYVDLKSDSIQSDLLISKLLQKASLIRK